MNNFRPASGPFKYYIRKMILGHNMRRKIKTTPFQRKMLWAMANEGRVSLLALLDALTLKFPADSPSWIFKKAERGIGVLERQGLLYLIWQFDSEERSVLTI